VRKFFSISIIVLALSGCAAYHLAQTVELATNVLIKPAVEYYEETERETERERERENKKKQSKFCWFNTCLVSCLNKFDECNTQAKASCKGGDFKVVNKRAHTLGKGIKHDLFFSCKEKPKNANEVSD